MSFEASAWAIKAAVSRSSTKNLLMILAHITNDETEELYPSLAYLEAHTGLSRKTVIDCMAELESPELGVLVRTGEMKGRTGQIPVYRFVKSPAVPTIKKGTGGKFHRSDQAPETVAILPGKGDVFAKETVVKTPPGIEKRNREEEYNPPSLTGGCPQTDFLGEISDENRPLATPRPTIVEHVKQGWEALSERFPRVPSVRAWSDARKRGIARRADEVVRASGGALDAYQVWDQIFAAIAGDRWLRGEADAGRGHDRPYVIEIDHVLRTGGTPNFLWILERAATNDQDNRVTSDPTSGRRLGPAEQATRAALARIRAAGEQRGAR